MNKYEMHASMNHRLIIFECGEKAKHNKIAIEQKRCIDKNGCWKTVHRLWVRKRRKQPKHPEPKFYEDRIATLPLTSWSMFEDSVGGRI